MLEKSTPSRGIVYTICRYAGVVREDYGTDFCSSQNWYVSFSNNQLVLTGMTIVKIHPVFHPVFFSLYCFRYTFWLHLDVSVSQFSTPIVFSDGLKQHLIFFYLIYLFSLCRIPVVTPNRVASFSLTPTTRETFPGAFSSPHFVLSVLIIYHHCIRIVFIFYFLRSFLINWFVSLISSEVINWSTMTRIVHQTASYIAFVSSYNSDL